MVEKWKLALKEFLKDYEEDDDVIGAILGGSYANGNETDGSDINVSLILKDSVNYQKRGNTESNSFIIEYVMKPAYKIMQDIEEEHENSCLLTANMIAYGKIIYDLEGTAKKIQDYALAFVDCPLRSITADELSINNYNVWEYYDELKNLLKENDSGFIVTYYKLLEELMNAYCEFLELPKLPLTKTYKILTNEDYRKKYHIFKLPEAEFIKLYIRCYDVTKVEIMYQNITNLVNYYYDKIGGFNIRTFEIKTIIDGG